MTFFKTNNTGLALVALFIGCAWLVSLIVLIGGIS